MSNHNEHPSERASQYQLAQTRTTWIAGRRYHPRAILRPGEAVNLVREPSNPHDGNAIAVVTLAGERAGYLPREVAADWAGLVDERIIHLAARLAAPGEIDFDADRFAINPRIYLWAYLDPGRLDEFLAQVESPARAG